MQQISFNFEDTVDVVVNCSDEAGIATDSEFFFLCLVPMYSFYK